MWYKTSKSSEPEPLYAGFWYAVRPGQEDDTKVEYLGYQISVDHPQHIALLLDFIKDKILGRFAMDDARRYADLVADIAQHELLMDAGED